MDITSAQNSNCRAYDLVKVTTHDPSSAPQGINL